MIGILGRTGKSGTQRHREKAVLTEAGIGVIHLTNQGMPKIAGNHLKLKKRQEIDFSSKETSPTAKTLILAF